MSECERPLCLLSLDGGGIKGVTTLLILREIFKGVKKHAGRDMHPWEIFDLIGGTSTGGLIAIMLGYLHFSIDECLKYYEELADKIFVPRLKSKGSFKWINAEVGGTWFNGKDLEDAVKDLLRRISLEEDLAFRRDGEQKCKVFVSAVRSTTVREVLIRSYHTDTVGQQNYDCSVWEAARATSAAPACFGPIRLRGTNAATFIDGGVRANNPIELVMKEARDIWNSRTIGCVLSIGTGRVHIKAFKDNAKLHQIVKTMTKIATDADAIARRFRTSGEGKDLADAGKYYRFNVEHGMEEVDLCDTSKIQHMKDFTEPYVEDEADRLLSCSKALASSSLAAISDDISCTRNLSNYSIPSSEPLSVAASVVGLLVVGSHMSSSLSSIVTKVHDAPNLARSLRQEITDISATLGHLQPYITDRAKASADRASLILLEDVLTTLTGCVTTYSDIQAILESLNLNPEMGAFDRTKWAQQESKITVTIQRLRDHKSSLHFIREILHCEFKQEAENSNRKLCALVKQALETNQDLKARIKRLEHEGSIHSDAASRIGASDDSSITRETTVPTCSPLLGMDKVPPRFTFEQDLAGSRVYNKPVNRYSLSSLTSSILYTTALSIFSKLSLSEVSNISFYALPVYAFDLSNSEYYVFGEEGVGRGGIRDGNSVDEVPDNASLVQRSGSATSELPPIKRQMPRRLLGRFARRRQGDTKARARSLAIDRNLEKDARQLKRECKVLLLGSDESGRSDIAKTFKIIHQNGYTVEELAMYRHTIYKNVIDSAKALIGVMKVLEIRPEQELNQAYCDFLLDYSVNPDPEEPLGTKVGEAISSIWQDPCIPKILDRSSEFYIRDSATYFFDEVKRISSPDYIPIEADVLRARTKQTGIHETRFTMGRLNIHLFDVSELTTERKWIHCFENITSIIFVVDLASYDQVLLEESSQNRMMESLVYFDSVVNSNWFMRTSIILLLGNVGKFKRKLSMSPLANYYPDYNGGNDVNRAAKYIIWRFDQVNHAHLDLYPYLIEFHDPSNMPLVFAAIKKTVRRNFYRDTGIL